MNPAQPSDTLHIYFPQQISLNSWCVVKPLSTLQYLNLATLSKPSCDRTIYKLIKKHKFRNFVEIGMGNGTRAINIIRVAQKFSTMPNIRYTGVDLFEARLAGDPLQLIEMHRSLKSDASVKSQLVPGGTLDAIPRIANSHVRTDLILISGDQDQSGLAINMKYLPRMLHSESLVLVQKELGSPFEVQTRLEIERSVHASGNKSKAA